MPKINGGFIILTSEEFKSFLSGELRDNRYLKSFYSEIKSINSKSIYAQNIKVIEEIDFNFEDEFIYEVTLSNCVFEKEINFNGGEFNQLWFTGCSFLERIKFNNGKFNHFLWFTGCDLIKGMSLYNGIFKSFHLTNCSSGKQIQINGGIFDELHLSSSEQEINVSINGLFLLINYLSISGGNFKKINIKDCSVNVLVIYGVFNRNSLIFIENIRIYSFLFKKLINLGNIFLSDIRIDHRLTKYKESPIEDIFDSKTIFEEYDLENVKRIIERRKISSLLQYVNNFYESSSSFLKRNESNFYNKLFYKEGKKYDNLFINVKTSSLHILSSTLGNTEFKNIKINSFEDITLDSSDLSFVKLINAKFPTKKGRIKSIKNKYKNLYHLFNDLYSTSSKQNNIKEKLDYYKASQENLFLMTKEEGFSFNKIASLISLKTSKFYSDYGQNWLKALFLTVFLFGFIFYGLFLLSMKDIELDLSIKGFKYFSNNLLEYFPEFINPTHKLSYFNNYFDTGKWSLFVDLISRVFIGMGIFEMIRSFRKYVRK